MVTSFKTEADAKRAIQAAIAAGKADSGHVSENWGGPGGRMQFLAHVRKQGTGWCL